MFALVASAGGCQSDEAPADAIPVPSGRVVTLIEIVSDIRGPEGATARFRFLAPGLSEDEVEAAATDMEALCNTFALARIDGVVPKPQQIIVSLSAAPVPFGEAAPDVVQFFEAYDVTGGSCVWSVF
ncbi:MAG: hypothetical protein B7Z10_06160 [Rhodobacterales bacterium 32-66-7]|nr:MAG: hypothetical protein B7Z31_05885 [Rhodobacterales bacterium 12-65-15]OYX25510.1 MAG: hypothetical protein B7Z10_06160 [Rhodobacterales bacterium 32-66-7]